MIPRARFFAVRSQALSLAGMAVLGSVALTTLVAHSKVRPGLSAAGGLLATAWAGAGVVVTWQRALGLLVMGLATGTLGGMLGMGAGMLKVAGMLLVYDTDICFARAVAIAAMFVVSVSAAPAYLKSGWGQRRSIYPMILGAVPGTLAGAFLGNRVTDVALLHTFGLLALFLSLCALSIGLFARRPVLLSEDHSVTGQERAASISIFIGSLHGFLCGLLGISGGLIATPMQQAALHAPLRQAIANTLVVSAVATALGAVPIVYHGVSQSQFTLGDIIVTTLFIGLGALVGARLGSKIGRGLDVTIPRLLFEATGIWIGLSILF